MRGCKGKSLWQIDAGISTHNRSVNRGFNRKTNAASLKYTTITRNPPLQRGKRWQEIGALYSAHGHVVFKGSVLNWGISKYCFNQRSSFQPPSTADYQSYSSYKFFLFALFLHFLFLSCRTMTFVVQFTDIIQSVQTCSYFTNVQLVEETRKFCRLDS